MVMLGRITCLFLLLTLFGYSCKLKESVEEYRLPEFKGVAYVQVYRGDHIVVLNLENGEIGRIIPGKSSRAISLSEDGKIIYVFSNDGHIKRIGLTKGGKSDWKRVVGEVCAASKDVSGNIWFIDSKTLKLYVYSPINDEIEYKMETEKGICGISLSNDGQMLYLSNREDSTIKVLNARELKAVEDIKDSGNSIHNAKLAPSGNELWVAEGNEFRNGNPYGVGYAKGEAMPGGINILNLQSRKIEDFIIVGGNVVDMEFSSDGKYAFVISSQMPEYDEASLSVVDVQKRRVIKNYALCKPCHIWKGVKLPDNKAFVSAIQIDLNAENIEKIMENPFISGKIPGESMEY